MPDYFNGKKRPEPGRPANLANQPVINVSAAVDTNAIAEAVIKAIEKKLPTSVRVIGRSMAPEADDGFDTSTSMDKLADVMTMGKNNESNFDGLGSVKKVKKDIKDTNKTIDLLKDIE